MLIFKKIMHWIKNHKKLSVLVLLSILFITFWLYPRVVEVNLPSDEEMIKHLQENRADIEELIRRYRAFEAPINAPNPHYGWDEQDEIKALFNKTGIGMIGHISNSVWLPDPYSLATAKKVHRKFHTERPGLIFYQHAALTIRFKPEEVYSRIDKFRGYYSKKLVYFPIPPRVKYGYLLGPVKTDGEYFFETRVYSSLNYWHGYGCVYRQIEAQWFISMCSRPYFISG